MTTINHEVNEMIQLEEDTYNVIVDLKAMLEHYVSGRAGNSSTRTQAVVTIKEANQLLKKLRANSSRLKNRTHHTIGDF